MDTLNPTPPSPSTVEPAPAVRRRVRKGQQIRPSVTQVPRTGELSVSIAEEEFLRAIRENPLFAAFNINHAIRFTGGLDADALEKSLHTVIQRHEVLRTTYRIEGERAWRVIAPSVPQLLTRLSLRSVGTGDREEAACRLLTQHARRQFDPAVGPLIHALLIALDVQDHVFLVTFHHIVCDAGSLGVFVSELMAVYAANAQGREADLPVLGVQYADYATWQRQWLSGPVEVEQTAYWRKQLSGRQGPLSLPADHPRATRTGRAGVTHHLVGRETLDALATLSHRAGVTLFTTTLSLFTLLLSEMTGATDISIWVPGSNRDRSELEGMIGLFLDFTVFRLDLSGEPTFLELLRRVFRTGQEAHTYRGVSILSAVAGARQARLDQVMFNMIGAIQDGAAPTKAPLKDNPSGLQMQPFLFPLENPVDSDLILNVSATSRGLYCALLYSADLFSAERMDQFLSGYAALAKRVVARTHGV
jgi:hypothetical protein